MGIESRSSRRPTRHDALGGAAGAGAGRARERDARAGRAPPGPALAARHVPLRSPGLRARQLGELVRAGATSTSSTSTTSRWSAGPAFSRTARASSSTRRTSTGSSAPCTRSGGSTASPASGPHACAARSRIRRPPQLWRYTGPARSARSRTSTCSWRPASSRSRHTGRAASGGPCVRLPHFSPLDGGAEASRDADERPARPYFLVVGRLERLKGVQTLIEALPALRRRRLGRGRGGYVRRRAPSASGRARATSAFSADCLQTRSAPSTAARSRSSRPPSATRRSA